jgi:transcriptional regulator with XRE-family HTH domain
MLDKSLGTLSVKEKNLIKKHLLNIGQEIQRVRKERNLTQEELAEQLELNVNTIKYIEQGRRTASLPMLIRIVQSLNMHLKIGNLEII